MMCFHVQKFYTFGAQLPFEMLDVCGFESNRCHVFLTTSVHCIFTGNVSCMIEQLHSKCRRTFSNKIHTLRVLFLCVVLRYHPGCVTFTNTLWPNAFISHSPRVHVEKIPSFCNYCYIQWLQTNEHQSSKGSSIHSSATQGRATKTVQFALVTGKCYRRWSTWGLLHLIHFLFSKLIYFYHWYCDMNIHQ